MPKIVRGPMPLNPPDARLGVGRDGKSYVEGSTYTWADLTYAESRADMLELQQREQSERIDRHTAATVRRPIFVSCFDDGAS